MVLKKNNSLTPIILFTVGLLTTVGASISNANERGTSLGVGARGAGVRPGAGVGAPGANVRTNVGVGAPGAGVRPGAGLGTPGVGVGAPGAGVLPGAGIGLPGTPASNRYGTTDVYHGSTNNYYYNGNGLYNHPAAAATYYGVNHNAQCKTIKTRTGKTITVCPR